MPDISIPIKQFVDDSYQIVSASSPTVPLKSNDTARGIYYLNRLISSFSGTGLLLTVAKEVRVPMTIGEKFITFGSPTYTPLPDYIGGRLANCQNAWVVLDNLTYPLTIVPREVFLDSYKFFPQQGLPRFAIIFNETNLTRVQIYPAPSQFFEAYFYGKFQLPTFTENSDMSSLPDYYFLFFQMALAKYLSRIKGRSSAWTPDLEADLVQLKKDMESVSTVNLAITSDHDSYLNGSWRVRAGI